MGDLFSRLLYRKWGMLETTKQTFFSRIDVSRATVKCEMVGLASHTSYKARNGRLLGIHREYKGTEKYYLMGFNKEV